MRHTVVVDLGFGDAGKGSVVDWLGVTSRPAAVVRFNGGAQAAHNVVTPDGRHHTFAQFGSATLHGVPTLLSRHVLVEPLALAAEATALAGLGVPDPFGLLRVDRRALLTTPYHAAVNRARERARGGDAHGTCGIGIGETMAYALAHPDDAPRAGDCTSPSLLRRKLTLLREWAGGGATVEDLGEAYAAFAGRVLLVGDGEVARLARRGSLVFEGAQGVLLDEWHGFHPHTTWSTTTFANALELLAESGDAGDALRVGVTRTYATRHGAGPFVTEDQNLLPYLPEPHNGAAGWQGAFRVGHLDLVGLRYAAEVCGGLDAIALTHTDARAPLQYAYAWETGDRCITRLPVAADPDPESADQPLTRLAFAARPVLAPAPDRWSDLLAAELGAPVLVESNGPTWRDKTMIGAETWEAA